MIQESVNYQLSKEILASLLWRRTFVRSPLFFATIVQLFISVWLIYIGGRGLYIGIPIIMLGIWTPYKYYRRLVSLIDHQSQMTDPKILTFDQASLMIAGPDWRKEFTWSHFNGFSEDHLYFYLHLSPGGFASIIPKSAFQSDQLKRFREFAALCNA
ncbi:MAG: YcxB family protein [Acidobacteria bacterium]|nr:YcxB family protein [Acidobacteriota bacterium]MBI3490151.1 YcxB family protein [Acidobacteriota bacterium]